MQYSIIVNPKYTNCSRVGIETIPENKELKFFLSSLRTKNFPSYLNDLTEEKSFGVENASFGFYHEMDWEDKAGLEHLGGIKEREICIYLYDGRTNYAILSEILFVQVFYDYSVKLLEVYRTDSSLPVAWAMDMEDSLRKLKHLIDAKKNM
ncbi:MAG: hypothetical protein CRN43_02435 [Candidatus Nephrothrix sp. EaCA]|nr:MAG: hypothetical protein CRN43_02435 [Candidatus Nephrothrix sp. EaCA]